MSTQNIKSISFKTDGTLLGLSNDGIWNIDIETAECTKIKNINNYESISIDFQDTIHLIKEGNTFYLNNINDEIKTDLSSSNLNYLNIEKIYYQTFDKNNTRYLLVKLNNDNKFFYLFTFLGNNTNKYKTNLTIKDNLILFYYPLNDVILLINENNNTIYELNKELNNSEIYIFSPIMKLHKSDNIGDLITGICWNQLKLKNKNIRYVKINKKLIDFTSVNENTKTSKFITIANLSPYSERVKFKLESPIFKINEKYLNLDNKSISIQSGEIKQIEIICDTTNPNERKTNYHTSIVFYILDENTQPTFLELKASVNRNNVIYDDKVIFNDYIPSTSNEENIMIKKLSFTNNTSFNEKIFLESKHIYWCINEENNYNYDFIIKPNETKEIDIIFKCPIINGIAHIHSCVIYGYNELYTLDIKIPVISYPEDYENYKIIDTNNSDLNNIDFINVETGETDIKKFKLHNLSYLEKKFKIEIIENDENTFFDIENKKILEVELQPDETIEKELKFSPTTINNQTDYNATLLVEVINGYTSKEIPITAKEIRNDLKIYPKILSYTEREVNTGIPHENDPTGFYITNQTNKTFSYLNYQISDNFTLLDPIPNILEPGVTYFIKCNFTPIETGNISEILKIYDNDNNLVLDEDFSLHLNGESVESGSIEIGPVSTIVYPPNAYGLKWKLKDEDENSWKDPSDFKYYFSIGNHEIEWKDNENWIPEKNINRSFNLTSEGYHHVEKFIESFKNNSLSIEYLDNSPSIGLRRINDVRKNLPKLKTNLLGNGFEYITGTNIDNIGVMIKNNTSVPIEIYFTKSLSDEEETWNESNPYSTNGTILWNDSNSSRRTINPGKSYLCKYLFRPKFEKISSYIETQLEKIKNIGENKQLYESFTEIFYVKIKNINKDLNWPIYINYGLIYPTCIIDENTQLLDFGIVNKNEKKIKFLKLQNILRYNQNLLESKSLNFTLPNHFNYPEVLFDDDQTNFKLSWIDEIDWNLYEWNIPIIYEATDSISEINKEVIVNSEYKFKDDNNNPYLIEESCCSFTLKAKNTSIQSKNKKISVSPNNIDFGTVYYGNSKVYNIEVENISDDIINFAIGDYDESLEINLSGETTIDPNETIDFEIKHNGEIIKNLKDSPVDLFVNGSNLYADELYVSSIPDLKFYNISVDIKINDSLYNENYFNQGLKLENKTPKWNIEKVDRKLYNTEINSEKEYFESQESCEILEGTSYKLVLTEFENWQCDDNGMLFNLTNDINITVYYEIKNETTQLTINLKPLGINSGWRLLGESSWRDSGDYIIVNREPINANIEFKSIPNYIKPLNTTIDVKEGLIKEQDFIYTAISEMNTVKLCWNKIKTNIGETPGYRANATVFQDEIYFLGNQKLLKTTNGYNWTQINHDLNLISGSYLYEFNNKLYILNSDNENVYVYESSNGNIWELKLESENINDFPKYDFSNIISFKNKLYCVGYEIINYENLRYNRKATLFISDDGINWNQYKNMPFSNRQYSTLFTFENKLWLLGGRGGEYILDTDYNDIWYTIDGSSWYRTEKNADFSPRHGCAIINYEDQVWMFGGTNNHEETSQEVWLTTDCNQWNKSENCEIHWNKTENPAFVLYNNKLWKISGLTDPSIWNSNPESSTKGNITVKLKPYNVRNKDAKWKIDDGGWMDSGSTIKNLTSGVHSITFKNVSGWIKPNSEEIIIPASDTLIKNYEYQELGYGNITININPISARNKGRWKLNNENTWREHGDSININDFGNYTIKFKDINSWVTPNDLNFDMYNNTNITKTGVYILQTDENIVQIECVAEIYDENNDLVETKIKNYLENYDFWFEIKETNTDNITNCHFNNQNSFFIYLDKNKTYDITLKDVNNFTKHTGFNDIDITEQTKYILKWFKN
jgi:hypothetical protein